MKRTEKFVLVAAIALLVANPVFANSICLFGLSTLCVSACPMAMEGMGSDCEMAGPMLATGCAVNCCSHATSEATETYAAPNTARAAAQPAVLADLAASSAPGLVMAGRNGVVVRGEPPPIYILNRVFRI